MSTNHRTLFTPPQLVIATIGSGLGDNHQTRPHRYRLTIRNNACISQLPNLISQVFIGSQGCCIYLGKHDREMNRFPLKKFGNFDGNESHPEGVAGANIRFGSMVI